MNSPPEKQFLCNDGRRLKNTDELANALISMSEATYKHHVTKDKNDFAKWIEDVFGKKELAARMREAGGKQEMARTIRMIKAKKAEKKTAKKKAARKPQKDAVKKKTVKKSAKKPAKRKAKLNEAAGTDEKYRVVPEMTNTHIATATNVALGIVVGSAVTLLILALM